jgi:hypothetical protein
MSDSKSAYTIEFQCTVEKVTTLADGGLRVSFDLPEDAIAEAALLMECKRNAIVLFCSLATEKQG